MMLLYKVKCYKWLYLIIMSCTSFKVNPHTIVCLNVKQLLAQSRRHIWSLSDSNGIWSHNELVRKRTLNHLAKLAKWLHRPNWLSGCGFESRCWRLNYKWLWHLPLHKIFHYSYHTIMNIPLYVDIYIQHTFKRK